MGFQKYALALSGGALRGAAHIGVLQLLSDHGMIPDLIAGTSVGSVIGTLYATGMSLERMEEIARQLTVRKLLDVSIPIREIVQAALFAPLYYMRFIKTFPVRIPPGFINGNLLEDFLRALLLRIPSKKKLPYLIVTTDLVSGETVVFYDGIPDPPPYPHVVWLICKDPARLMRASCSLPGVILPVPYDGRLLVDGALRNNLPVDILHHLGYKKVLAVDLHKAQMDDPWIPSFFSVLDRMLDIMLDESMDSRANPENTLLIRPDCGASGWTAWDSMPGNILAGKTAAAAMLPDLKSYLSG